MSRGKPTSDQAKIHKQNMSRAFGRSIKGTTIPNAKRNADALKKMSRAKRETGMTAEELEAYQHEQCERILKHGLRTAS